VAKRLCDLAEGGQIVTSDVVGRLVGNRIDSPLEPLGQVQLKGLSIHVAACLVAWDGAIPARQAAAAATKRPITVIIADDQRMVRGGLRVILDSEPDISVLAEAEDGIEAVELVRTHAPAVAMLDIRMPNMNGLLAAREILEICPGTRVLILTTFDADEYVFEALRVGASGFLLKDAPPAQLVAAVKSIAAGDALIDPSVTRRLISRFTRAVQPSPTVPEAFQSLTPRELDVLKLVARGLSNQEIAVDLVVEESTVKTHISRILMKLDLRDRVQAVVLAYESGLVAAKTA
jgi:DNA-binding NarL/FixJ family response regulator